MYMTSSPFSPERNEFSSKSHLCQFTLGITDFQPMINTTTDTLHHLHNHFYFSVIRHALSTSTHTACVTSKLHNNSSKAALLHYFIGKETKAQSNVPRLAGT